jgi:CPA1 family monovalent cation:H+ antiporter
VPLSTTNGEERLARRQILKSAIDEICVLLSEDIPGNKKVLGDLLHVYQQRFEEVRTASATSLSDTPDHAEYRRLESRLRAVERSTVLRMRDQNQINDEVLRKVERELDLMEARHLSRSS